MAEIADAALTLLDGEGLDAVSFRRVAAELGVSHMTLYSYLDSKEALLDVMVGRALEVPELTHPQGDWAQSLREVLVEIHDALVARPGIAQLIITTSLDGPWVIAVRDRLVGLLRPAGFTRAQSVDAISVLVNYVLGTALVEASRGSGASPRAFTTGLDLLIDGLRRRVEDSASG
ncbi:TetR/AcrR family transcriptional regulator [Sporichthya brevicatena]|uniref:TetR/AcrR family transcriptional regulator n=1 Tax=Sporichthya brevicatena TaxID=171442 RepID=A0ABN1H8R1_9ACTN